MESPAPKEGVSKEGKPMHYSAGAIIKQGGKYLLIDRATPPFGFAGVAGHVDEGEDPETAVIREIEEEVGLKAEKCTLLAEEEVDWNWCGKGVGVHHWYVYECEVSGELAPDERETKHAGWYTIDAMKSLSFEPVWKYWFEKFNIL